MTSDENKNHKLQTIIRQYSNTNSAPPDEDIEYLHPFRNQTSKEFLDFNTELCELQSLILTMCSRIAELRCLTTGKESSLNIYNSILSPLRRFPPEILEEIFLQCKDEASREPPTKLRRQPPNVLSRVCRSWRQVAMNLPKLWDTFRVNHAAAPNPLHRSTPMVPLYLILDIWASRSKTLPLNVAIHSNRKLSGSQPFPSSLVTSLLDLSNRIRKLDIQTDLKSVFESLFSLPAAEFLALESLHLSVIESGVWDRTITAFGASPNLRKVTLNISPAHPFCVSLPWSQITHLDMLRVKDPLDFFTWNFIIRSVVNLVQGLVRLAEELRVAQDPFRRSLLRIYGPTERTLPALNFLTINFVNQGGVNGVPPFISPNIYIPALTHFHFSSSLHPLSWYPTLQETLVPHILDQLKSLTLLNVRMEVDKLIDVLREATSLEELKFNSKCSIWTLRDNISFLETLSIKGPGTNPEEPGDASIAPRLRKIGLWVDDMCSELLQSYTSLIQARRWKDPENAVLQGTEDFRVLLILDKNRSEVIQAIAPLLVISDSRGQKFVDVELVEVY